MTSNFICPRSDCATEWSLEPDEDGLFDGYGNPPCPICGENGVDPTDFEDWVCAFDHTWRKYGNGGLVFGMVPRCPECDMLPVNG